jgi:hypothetical protein
MGPQERDYPRSHHFQHECAATARLAPDMRPPQGHGTAEAGVDRAGQEDCGGCALVISISVPTRHWQVAGLAVVLGMTVE